MKFQNIKPVGVSTYVDVAFQHKRFISTSIFLIENYLDYLFSDASILLFNLISFSFED